MECGLVPLQPQKLKGILVTASGGLRGGEVKGLSWRRDREDESPLMQWPRGGGEEEIHSTWGGGLRKGKTTSSFRRWGEYQYHYHRQSGSEWGVETTSLWNTSSHACGSPS